MKPSDEKKVHNVKIKSIKFKQICSSFDNNSSLRHSMNPFKSRNYYSPEQRLMHGQIKDISDIPSPNTCNLIVVENQAITKQESSIDTLHSADMQLHMCEEIKVTPGCKNCMKAKQRIIDHQDLNVALKTQIRKLQEKLKRVNLDEFNNQRRKIDTMMLELDTK